MVVKRRRACKRSGRRTKRARRYFKRGRRYGGRGRRIRGVMMRCRRIVALGSSSAPYLTFGTTATSGFWRFITPTLNDALFNFATGSSMGGLTNISEYNNLFDLYKLNAIKYTFRPQFPNINFSGPYNSTGTTNTVYPLVCILKDPESRLTPTGTFDQSSLNILLEGGGKIYRGDRPFSVYLKPKISEQYGGGANRYVRPQWTDLSTTAGQTMPHSGFHMYAFNEGFDSTALSSFHRYQVVVTYYLQFKNQK